MRNDSLDTCVLISILLGEPANQRDLAWELLETGDMHHIADLTISEAVYVLEYHYKQTREQIVNELRSFLSAHGDVIIYNRNLFDHVFPYYVAQSSLSFNDCYLAFHAELGHAEPLFTFDKKLAAKHPSAKLLQ